MNDSVPYSSNSSLTKQIRRFPSESEDLTTYNIFKIIASVCNACVSKISDFLPTPSVPTYARACKTCNHDECIDYVDQIESDSIELRLLYEKKTHEDLERAKYKNYSCKPCYACSINQAKSITYCPWQHMAGNPAYGDGGKIDLRRFSRFGIPIETHFQDFQSASIQNYPFLTQGKHVDVYEPICEKVFYLCGQCKCKYKSQLEWHSRENLEPQSCKCSLCECLSCPFQKEGSFAEESLKSLKRNVMPIYIENEWKGSLRNNKHEIQACRTPNICRHFRDSTKITVGKLSKEKSPVKCSKHGHNRKRWQCSKKENNFNNAYTDGSDFEIKENDKNVSTVNPNKILTDQLLKNMYGECTVVNHETNTENLTSEKCTETGNLLGDIKSFADNKVKSYEYTLKIEIIAPNVDDNINQDMKQRIKKASNGKIIEQTQKVMKDVMKDISNNLLLHEMFDTEKPNTLQPSDCETPEDMGPQEQNIIRSILKKTSTVSLKSSTMTENQNSSDMVTALPRSKVSNKMEDFIVGCVTPLKNTRRRTGKEIAAKKSELLSGDDSILSQKSVKCLEDLRVREPCLRRVSNHTVSLKWKMPTLIEEIMGYEILVDGKIIEKILNPKRCLAVVSCLPPVRRLMLTIRTLPKTPSLRGLYPCTTIGYQPRDNKCVHIA